MGLMRGGKRTWLGAAGAALALALVFTAAGSGAFPPGLPPAHAQAPSPSPTVTIPDSEGVKVRRASFLRKLVSAERLEKDAALQFVHLKRTASQKRALVPAGDPRAQRLQRIARDLLPHTGKWNDRAKTWQWEVSLIASKNINAFCMPGGKIAFFTGIIERLQLNDDEIAMVMGHEIAHALREHARARVAKTNIVQIGGRVLGSLILGQAGEAIGAGAGSLLTLKFSRDDEKDADLIGMELAARAGYDPRAGVTLWQKMDRAAKGAPPQWMSTHPASKTRITLIQKSLPDVMPIYERTRPARLERDRGREPIVVPAGERRSPWNHQRPSAPQTESRGGQIPPEVERRPRPPAGSIPPQQPLPLPGGRF
jgi:hypothetical protein